MQTAVSTLQLQPVSRFNTFPSRLNDSFRPPIEVEAVEVVEDIITPQFTKRLPFIEANTKEVTINHLKDECVVPVFSKDNEITISHPAFIEAVWSAASKVFPRESIEKPSIRVSHVIKGRTPEAIHKNVKELLDEDKTIYYERMMFAFEIPSRVRRDYLRICYLFLSVANQHIIRFWILPELGLFGEFSHSVHNLYDSVVNSCIGRFLRIMSSH